MLPLQETYEQYRLAQSCCAQRVEDLETAALWKLQPAHRAHTFSLAFGVISGAWRVAGLVGAIDGH